MERDSKLWRWSKYLEEVRGSGGCRRLRRQYRTKLLRRQEALEAVEGCGEDQRLGRRSKAPEAASTKLWRLQEVLEAEGGSGRCLGGSRGGLRLRR
jgi:hypothetical protein